MQTQKVGYAGHRKGTIKEKAHKVFDDITKKGKKTDGARQVAIKRIVRLGATEGTAATWYQTFLRDATKPRRKAKKAKRTVH